MFLYFVWLLRKLKKNQGPFFFFSVVSTVKRNEIIILYHVLLVRVEFIFCFDTTQENVTPLFIYLGWRKMQNYKIPFLVLSLQSRVILFFQLFFSYF